MTCSCGKTQAHVIARRTTFDGKHVCLWNDGSMTWALGQSIKGAWFKPAPANRQRALRAGRLAMGEVCLYEAKEVPDLIKAARWVADRRGLPGDVRARVAFKREATRVRPHWITVATDRDGKVIERVWRLPDLGPWRGHVVWDLVSRGRSRGRYQIMRRIAGRRGQDETFHPTGVRFDSQRDLLRWMMENAPIEVQ